MAFDDVRRDHFSALVVRKVQSTAPADDPLRLYVNPIGDAAETEFPEVRDFLERELNVILIETSRGAPLYLTREDLVATSGAGALGATVRSGMVVEVRDGTLSGCVLAHEVLHFLGLHHVEEHDNLMYPRCAPGKLDRATLEPWQREEIDHLQKIRSFGPGGIATWAER